MKSPYSVGLGICLLVVTPIGQNSLLGRATELFRPALAFHIQPLIMLFLIVTHLFLRKMSGAAVWLHFSVRVKMWISSRVVGTAGDLVTSCVEIQAGLSNNRAFFFEGEN